MVLDDYTVLTPKQLDGASQSSVAGCQHIRRQTCLVIYTCKIQGNWKYNIVSYYSPTGMIILWLVMSVIILMDSRVNHVGKFRMDYPNVVQ